MKKITTTVAAAVLLSATFLYADENKESYIDYVSVGIALQDVDNSKFDQGGAFVVNAGKDIYSDMSVEVEGSVGIEKPEAKFNGKTHDVDFWSLGIYGTYIWKVNKLSIKPRLGVVYESIKSTLNVTTNNEAAMTTGTNRQDLAVSGGIGIAYDIDKNYKIYTNYTKFEDDMEHLTFGAEYKF